LSLEERVKLILGKTPSKYYVDLDAYFFTEC